MTLNVENIKKNAKFCGGYSPDSLDFLKIYSQIPQKPRLAMKFMLKVAALVVAAKFILHTPEGSNSTVDQVAKTTVRDLARHVDSAYTALETKIKKLLS